MALIDTHVNGKPRAIALMGPTASGKTQLAIALHQILGAEIISVDSAQVYRGLDIGAAKPSAEELQAAPHRLINIREPHQTYSAAEFCRDAQREMETIVEQGKIPLLVGGTMLYFKALLEGLSDMPSGDAEVRAGIDAEAAEKGWPAMHKELQRVDPETAASLHPNHSQRISRALEVYRVSGKPISAFRRTTSGGLANEYAWTQIAIAPRDRSVLHHRICHRFEQMLELGFIDEVKALRERPELNAELPAIKSVGYRQVWGYLDNECDFTEMKARAEAATRQLAKRQLTWLRSWPDLCWIYTQDENGAGLHSQEIVNKALRIFH